MDQVLISANEPNLQMRGLLKFHEVPYTVSKTNFEVGDYIIGGYETPTEIQGDIVIECETVGDLWGKVKSGRGNNQLVDLSFNFKLSILAVVGYVSLDLPEQAQVEYSVYMNSVMAGLSSASWKKCNQGVEGNIAVMNFPDFNDLAIYMKELLKLSDTQDPRIPKMERLSRKPEWQYLFFLQTIPGVGEARAKNLMFAFPRPYDLAIASVEEIMQVPDFGKKTAQKVHDFFRDSYDVLL